MRNRALALFCLLVWLGPARAETVVWLDELDLAAMSSGRDRPRANRSVGGNPLTVDGRRFARGVGTHAESWFVLEAGGQALAFEALVGVDDETGGRGNGSVVFSVYADRRLVARSKPARATQAAKRLAADLTGARRVILHVSDGGDGADHDHADWCEARFTLRDGAALAPSAEPLTRQLGRLTPPPPAAPRLTGPCVFGARPGSPVLFTVTATGERPLAFAAEGLPEGLALDARTGRLSGAVARPGAYTVTFRASNARGADARDWRLEIGERLALTPPMGWNSWNVFAQTVSDAKIRQAADALVASGLANHGWSYVNIDDFWQTAPAETRDASLMGPARDAEGRILPNRRFPDMPALADYVHGLGLKIGLYSSPGPTTCGGCAGSWGHEARDARSYADWGFDYLKYDLCSYPSVADISTLKGLMTPYRVMSAALRAQRRDIVHSICQYGMGHVSAWGAKAGGHAWRTTPDITDTWESLAAIIDAQDGLEPFAGPGAWNDADMLAVGTVGWGEPHPTRLTPNEQYTHLSLWCLFSSPLLIGCDLTRLDDFTLGLLTNDEVLAVNQDPLGRQAARFARDDLGGEVWAKPLADGSVAAGLVNRGFMTGPVAADFAALGLSGPQRARDLWRQRDLGTCSGRFEAEVPAHATVLVRFTPASP